MDFTREPIIETIISPKEGHKLLVKSSKQGNPEEYTVNAVEIVSFGSALFLRSMEGSRSFMLPVSDYEVIEVKEARMVLKNVSTDKPIKIGESKEEKTEEKESVKNEGESKKNSKKRHGKKRKGMKEENSDERNHQHPKKIDKAPEMETNEENRVSPAVVSLVFPTPPKIIGKTIPFKKPEEAPKPADEVTEELREEKTKSKEEEKKEEEAS